MTQPARSDCSDCSDGKNSPRATARGMRIACGPRTGCLTGPRLGVTFLSRCDTSISCIKGHLCPLKLIRGQSLANMRGVHGQETATETYSLGCARFSRAVSHGVEHRVTFAKVDSAVKEPVSTSTGT